jgi:hypothetical protein
VGALVYARGFEHHRLVRWSAQPWSTLEDRYTDTYTDMYGVLTWVSTAPERDRWKRDTFFDRRVAGRVVIDTLKEAQAFLTSTAAMLT